ncbi:MAG: GTP 3',8-cyclase MoaA, partial [Anaerolineae bacterium]
LAGIEAAERAGLHPIKIKHVVMRGLNDDEIPAFARLTLTRPWHIRFIEVMPVGETAGLARVGFVPAAEIRQRIELEVGPLVPSDGAEQGAGPARYYRLPNALGTVGFISAVSEHFCFHCNRLRLTADGKLRPCLLSDREVDIRAALRRGAGLEELQDIIRRAIREKPAGHHLAEDITATGRQMSQIGG